MKRGIEIFLLGIIVGIVIMLNVYTWVVIPKIKTAFQVEAIQAKVAEFYDDDGVIKFRFLTDHK